MNIILSTHHKGGDVRQTYDYIVMDIDTPLENTVQSIVQSEPNLILVPINPQRLALKNLPDTLSVIAQLEKRAGYSPEVIIVPLGTLKKDIEQKLQEIELIPKNCQIAPKVRSLPKITSLALEEGKYIWTYQNCSDIEQYFQSLVNL